ncbi:hypothetical protein C8R43DRAFT_506581 [Mycena crocata]|nr:hypothetical protein C8R43DRAFT_506581 [Mycena crocata]
MDRPSWTDTLRASLGSCIPCLTYSSGGAPSDENVTIGNGRDPSYAIRRARADELEGLLADSGEDGGDAGYADDDAAGDADAISLHSHLGPRGRRKPPPKKPRHISFFGFDLFGSGVGKGKGGRVKLPEGGAEPLHRDVRGTTGVNENADADGRARMTRNASTEALLSHSSPDAEALTDVSEADVERRARRKARKEMRRLAVQLAAQESVVATQPAPSPSAPGGIQAVFLPAAPSPTTPVSAPVPTLETKQEDAEVDEVDLDGGMYARLAPLTSAGGSRSSGRSSGSGSAGYYGAAYTAPPFAPHPQSKSKRSKRSKKSKSSATSSTLASLSPSTSLSVSTQAHFKLAAQGEEEFGAFTHAEEEEFDGTPGGFGFGVPEGAEDFDADADAAAERSAEDEPEIQREALPSPGLRRSRGFSASSKNFLAGF